MVVNDPVSGASAPSSAELRAPWAALRAAVDQLRSARFFERTPSVSAVQDAARTAGSAEQLRRSVRDACADRSAFLELGRALTDAHAGLVGTLIMAQPTGRAAVEQLFRYQELLGGPPWTLEQRSERVYLGYRPDVRGEGWVEWAELAVSAAYHAALRFWGARTGGVIGVELAFAEPRGGPDYTHYFAGPVRFGAGRCGLVIPSALFDFARPGVDLGLARQMCDYAATQWAARGREGSWVARVESVMAPSHHVHELQLADVAKRLHVSPRTLRRRLAEAGTSFTTLSARLRDEQAARLLLETDMALNEIAGALGYADPASFRRACRRRFGQTPRQIRRAGFVRGVCAAP